MGEIGSCRRVTASVLTAVGSEPLTAPILYGRRRGRALRPRQKNLIDELLPALAVSLPSPGQLDPALLFGPERLSVWLEIGFGGGEHLAAQAQDYPEVGLIGCEVFENGIAKLLAQIERRRLCNIRVFTDDARRLIKALVPVSIDRVFVLFPDPWPKRRHHRRRIVSHETLDALADIMTDGAELRVATDDSDYLCWILERVTGHPAFRWSARGAADWRERPPDWPPSRYEEKARAAGRRPVFLRVRRSPRAVPLTAKLL